MQVAIYRILAIAKIIFFIILSLACLMVSTSVVYISKNLPEMLNERLSAMHYDMFLEAEKYRTTMDDRLSSIQKDLNKHLNEYNKTINNFNTTLDTTNKTLSTALDEFNNNLAITETVILKTTNDNLTKLDPTISNIETITTNLNTISTRLNTQEPMIYSRYLATTGELNRTLDALRLVSEEGAKAAPALSQSAEEITKNTADITANVKEYTKPKPFFKSLIPAAVSGVFRFLF